MTDKTRQSPAETVSHAIPAPERLRRMMIEVCPFRLGHRVTVSPSFRYAADYPGEYVIVGLAWEYQHGAGHDINVSIASDDDIIHRHGSTDGFSIDDLLPVTKQLNTFHRPEGKSND